MNNNKLYKNILLLSTLAVVTGLFFPQFCFAQIDAAPSTIDEAKTFIIKVITALPNAMKDVWKDKVLPIWQKAWKWFKGIWYQNIKPVIQNGIDKIKSLFQRKEVTDIKEEFEKEKEEALKELPIISKEYWDNVFWKIFRE